MNPQHQDFGNGLPPGLENHKSIGISKSKYCVVCLRNGTKTKSGWGVKTWSKCSECHVPLCSRRGERNCFYEYHLHAFGLEDRSTMLWQSMLVNIKHFIVRAPCNFSYIQKTIKRCLKKKSNKWQVVICISKSQKHVGKYLLGKVSYKNGSLKQSFSKMDW